MMVMNNVQPVSTFPVPILYLDATGYAGSGSTWPADIGSAATLINTPTYTAAAPTYFTFNGTDEAATTANLKANFASSNSQSLEIWVNTASDNGVVISQTGTSAIDSFYHLSVMEIVAGNVKMGIWNGTNIGNVTVGAATRNEWQQYVLTYDDATNTLTGYINAGTPASTTFENDPPVPGWFYHLCAEDGTNMGDGSYLAADVGLFRVWDTALTADQVQTLYDENRSRFQIVTDNLVVDLDAGNPNSYPGTGTTWTNLVGESAYTITDGAFDSGDGGSIVFNGTSTVVPIGIPLGNGANFTKEAWVNADVVTSSRNILSSANNVFWNNGSTLSGGVGGQFTLVTSASFPALAWRHVVLTFDDAANTMTLYINGAQVSQNTGVTQSYISEIERIGSHFFGGNPVSFWDGKIAQVRVYEAALTPTQVLQNFNATRATYGV
jgi:hypothetical protein